MAEYIEREALKNSFCNWCNEEYDDEPCEPDDCLIRNLILNAPAADVAPVVRCKDCRFAINGVSGLVCYRFEEYTMPDNFCNYGERKDGGGNG